MENIDLPMEGKPIWTHDRCRILFTDRNAPTSLLVYANYYRRCLWPDSYRIVNEHLCSDDISTYKWNASIMSKSEEEKWFPKEVFPNGISCNEETIKRSMLWKTCYNELQKETFLQTNIVLKKTAIFGLGWYSKMANLSMSAATAPAKGINNTTYTD